MLSFLPAGDDWYLCRLSLAPPTWPHLSWTMFPTPYLATVGPDALPTTRVYQLSARPTDRSQGETTYFLLDGELSKEGSWLRPPIASPQQCPPPCSPTPLQQLQPLCHQPVVVTKRSSFINKMRLVEFRLASRVEATLGANRCPGPRLCQTGNNGKVKGVWGMVKRGEVGGREGRRGGAGGSGFFLSLRFYYSCCLTGEEGAMRRRPGRKDIFGF